MGHVVSIDVWMYISVLCLASDQYVAKDIGWVEGTLWTGLFGGPP
jgi:hypothetical protein